MKKHLSIIIVYAIYASIVLIALNEVSRRDYWAMFIGWLITAPLIVSCLFYFGWKRYKRIYDVEENLDVTTDEDKLFPNKWTLLDFIKEFGRMKIGEFKNEYGVTFHKCACTKGDGIITEVSFFSQLGELTASEIKERKNQLFVGQMESGKYYLYAKGVKAWEEVNLEQ